MQKTYCFLLHKFSLPTLTLWFLNENLLQCSMCLCFQEEEQKKCCTLIFFCLFSSNYTMLAKNGTILLRLNQCSAWIDSMLYQCWGIKISLLLILQIEQKTILKICEKEIRDNWESNRTWGIWFHRNCST